MSNTKHTPGPWQAVKHPSQQMGMDYIWSDEGLIANVFGKDREQVDANAKLIAKAWLIPELLEALQYCASAGQECLDYKDGSGRPILQEAIWKAHALIQKANE